jgi:hypothetical protein
MRGNYSPSAPVVELLLIQIFAPFILPNVIAKLFVLKELEMVQSVRVAATGESAERYRSCGGNTYWINRA